MIANVRFSTGCCDQYGKPICFGDIVEIVICGCNPLIDTPVFGGRCPEPFRAVAQKRNDGMPGFSVPYQKGNLVWDVDGENCREVTCVS